MATKAEIEAQRQLNDIHFRLTAQSKKEICAVCEGGLVVIWHGKDGIYQLKCGRDKSHFGTKSCWDTAERNERTAKEMAMQTTKGFDALDKLKGDADGEI